MDENISTALDEKYVVNFTFFKTTVDNWYAANGISVSCSFKSTSSI